MLSILLLFSLIVGGCAKIQAPPGGPEDRTPPEIVSTTPATGSINIDRLEPLRIEFSEPIIRDKISEAIYISPRPPAEPEFGGGKKTIEIRWPDSLAENVTYLVTIAAQIADLRRNRLTEPYLLAFSTGPAIDSGVVTGMVFDGEKKAANAQVLLFSLPLDSAAAIFAPPDYITEGGPDGAFKFSYLPAGAYRAIAAFDKNKNRMLDFGEKAGVGAFDISLTPDDFQSPSLYLHLQDIDTTLFELSRGSVDQDRILRAVFSHPVDSAAAATARWSVTQVDDTTALFIRDVRPDFKEKTAVQLFVAGAKSGVSYRLQVGELTDRQGRQLDTIYNTAEFYWPSTTDTTAPAVAGSVPASGADGVDPAAKLQLWFSETVDTARAGAGFYTADTAGTRVPGLITWNASSGLVFAPDTTLAAGMQYLMVVDSAALVDDAGNCSAERWAAEFATSDPDDFGSVAGSLSVAREDWADRPIIVDFIAKGQKSHSQSRTLPGTGPFRLDLPADRYEIRATLDLNGNGRFDRGRVWPYVAAEPQYMLPEIIEVRARFTTEDVQLIIP